MLAALFVASETAEWSLNIVGLILMILLPFLFTPLHKEDQVESASAGKRHKL